MAGRWLLGLRGALMLGGALGGWNDNAVQLGVVQSSAAGGYRGEAGRVVAIREVPLRTGGSGTNDGTLIGGGVRAAGGAVARAPIGGTAGSAILGRGLGAPAGALAGPALHPHPTPPPPQPPL